MESRELSESMEQLEKDGTLNPAPAQEAGETVVENVESGEVAATAASGDSKYADFSKENLVSAFEELLQKPLDDIKDEVTAIKAAFIQIRKGEIEKEKAEFLAAGNEESAFAIKDDPIEARFKELINIVKEKRTQQLAEQEAVKAENLAKKQAIIEQIIAITDDPDNINRQFSKVQQLQQEFKAIGPVPASSDSDIWKSYQLANEKFYDLLKINKELRDYDFRKNLEIKQQLCAEAEALDEMDDLIAAYKKLQELHEKWRETGPVAKEIREDLWERFKNASSVIRKKHQAFFEERKSAEKENADAKVALCEKIETISTDGLKSYNAWEAATKQILALQEEWKKLGFASIKANKALFARFRKSCDDFFAKKADFFKTMKEELAANLAHKLQLCEKAEALKDSTEWKTTTEIFVSMQKEWKTIGPVVKKHSDAVWKRFNAACDAFFESKKKLSNNAHAVEHDNLKQKKELIAQLNQALESEDPKEGAAKVRELMNMWGTIGHVPFKEKDKIYADYREAVDKAFEKFDMRGSRANLSNFENNISQMSSDKANFERDRLVRIYEARCSELKTYVNNMGFLNANSKSGNSLVKELERKVEHLKEDIALLEQKIKMLDDKS
ncbi:MAG: DUF349 domain-containing protein [Muribaculaceae bacterium]|nr:DUF349 domain-containing protein [Muribaculaceae bacterium]